jgi:hypothetical protein
MGVVLSKYAENNSVYLAFATDGQYGVTDHAGIPAGESLVEIFLRKKNEVQSYPSKRAVTFSSSSGMAICCGHFSRQIPHSTQLDARSASPRSPRYRPLAA